MVQTLAVSVTRIENADIRKVQLGEVVKQRVLQVLLEDLLVPTEVVRAQRIASLSMSYRPQVPSQ